MRLGMIGTSKIDNHQINNRKIVKRNILTIVAFLILSTFSTTVFSHARWAIVPSDTTEHIIAPRSNSTGLKEPGPCGGVPRTKTFSTLRPGDVVTVKIKETIYHNGHFRIAFSPSSDTGFESNILIDNIPVVRDINNGMYTQTIMLPSIECDDCTLQLIQYMSDTRTNYYSCADIHLSREALSPNRVRGARIYDDFMIELAVASPGLNTLASLAEGGNIAADEWRCSGCHGFDYEGMTTFNGRAEINLHDLISVRRRDETFVASMLNDGFMLPDGSVAHSYAGILTTQAMVDVADFVVNEIYDVHEVLSAATGVALGHVDEGSQLYNSDGLSIGTGVPKYIRADGKGFGCGLCHEDATNITAAPLAELKVKAKADPFKFLHRISFGSPRNEGVQGFGYGDPTVMPGLYEVVFTDSLHFAGPHESAAAMRYIQVAP